MSQANQPINRQNLQKELTSLVERGSQTLKSWDGKKHFRTSGLLAVQYFYLFPIAIWLLYQLLTAAKVQIPTSNVLFYLIGSLGLAVLFVVVRTLVLTAKSAYGRQQALSLYDRQLKLQDRLVAADEFLGSENRNGFMDAAIEDASDSVQRAQRESLEALESPKWNAKAKHILGVAIALVVMFGLLWLDNQSTSTLAKPVNDELELNRDSGSDSTLEEDSKLPEDVSQLEIDARPLDDNKNVENRLTNPEHRQKESRKNEERTESNSKASGNQSANANSSTDSSGASSAPQQQNDPSQKKQEQDEAAKKNRKPQSTDKKTEPREQDEQKPSGVMSGRGTGKSSTANNDDLPTLSQKGRGATNPEDPNDDDGADDEDEQQKSETGNKPTLNTKKPAPSREAGGISPPPNPNENKSKKPPQRGGRSGIKKSRGVPSAILGVPTPDRLTGTPNSSRFKIQQEEADPKEEAVEPLNAQPRVSRSGEVGRLAHPELEIWQQNLVRDYFLLKNQTNESLESNENKNQENEE